MTGNLNLINTGLLLAGILLILAGIYNRSITELLRGIMTGDAAVFTPAPKQQESYADSGFSGGGGFAGSGGGSW